jgi:hypothetical protein
MSRWIVWAVPLAALLALLAAGPAAALSSCAQQEHPGRETLTLADYAGAIEHALDLVEGGDPAGSAGLLAGITAVVLPGGEVMPVDHGGFIAALEADPPDLNAVASRLATLRHELDAWPRTTVAPGAFEALAKVLARPEFQPERTPDVNPLSDWLNSLLARLPDLPPMPWLRHLLVIGGLAVLTGFVAYLVIGLMGSFVAQAKVGEEGTGVIPLTAGQALSRSRERAQAGDYRTAVRLLYLSTLLLLEERDLLRYDRTLTNREYLRQLAARPTLAGALRPVIDTFDEVWYGETEPGADEYEAYAEQVERLREVAG